MNKREVGANYEKTAQFYLEKEGYRVIEWNYRCRFGEIDIIARDDRYLVFIEVKYRTSYKMGSALEAVTKRKQAVIRKVSRCYLVTKQLPQDTPCRFDVIGITGEEVVLVKNAF